ncbi:MAG TPA: hypothetical protein VGC07_00325 [Granulicella sp.]
MVNPLHDPSADPPSSRGRLFTFVVVLIGLLIVFSMVLFLRSRRTDPPPKVPPTGTLPPVTSSLAKPQWMTTA